MTREFVTNTERETAAVGETIAASLRAGQVVLLSGPLGAGKTALVRGLAAGLGCERGAVSSPTFTIIQEYGGRTTLQHVDLYRLTPAEVDDLGLDDLMADAVLAVEWPERWRDPPAGATRVAIEPGPLDRRLIRVTAE